MKNHQARPTGVIVVPETHYSMNQRPKRQKRRGMTSVEVSCLANSATTHTVLRECIYFTNFIPKNAPMTTLSGLFNLIEGYGKARIMLLKDTVQS
ncbi:hypothetical protein ACFX14_008652 [Malus domestica]